MKDEGRRKTEDGRRKTGFSRGGAEEKRGGYSCETTVGSRKDSGVDLRVLRVTGSAEQTTRTMPESPEGWAEISRWRQPPERSSNTAAAPEGRRKAGRTPKIPVIVSHAAAFQKLKVFPIPHHTAVVACRTFPAPLPGLNLYFWFFPTICG